MATSLTRSLQPVHWVTDGEPDQIDTKGSDDTNDVSYSQTVEERLAGHECLDTTIAQENPFGRQNQRQADPVELRADAVLQSQSDGMERKPMETTAHERKDTRFEKAPQPDSPLCQIG